MSLFRSFLLFFFTLLFAIPCVAMPELEEDATATLLISNKGQKDLVGIRFIQGNTIYLSRLDLASGEEEELENPGGIQDLRLDFGLALCAWGQVPLTETKSITVCPEHKDCLLVTSKTGAIEHRIGTCENLLPGPGAKALCSLSKFHTGMAMKDACSLINLDYMPHDSAYITSLEFAGLVWTARLYSGGDSGSDMSKSILEDIELRQVLSKDSLALVFSALHKQNYVAWQAAFPGIDMNFNDMKEFDAKEKSALLENCIEAFLKRGSGEASIMFAPVAQLQALSASEGVHQNVQIFTVTLRRNSGMLVLDMAAYSAEERNQ